jgi:hypothetical protein
MKNHLILNFKECFIRILFIIYPLIINVSACTTENIKNIDLNENKENVVINKKPSLYNLKIIAYDKEINSSNKVDSTDQSFYRIFIDEKDCGRTDISFTNEIKTFTIMIDNGKKPVIRLEKYILDENKGKYIRVKNIFQPKAYSCESPILSDRITVITFVTDIVDGKTEIKMSYEKE